MTQKEAKKILMEECNKHYNTGNECFTKCKCRQNRCQGTTKDNKWNEELAERLKREK